MKMKIGFCDFYKGFNIYDNYWIKTLQQVYGKEAIEVVKKPDYLFYSCFGFSHLKYDCIKIFYTGENLVPDFNLCDYAIGFHEIDFNDRYLRLPLYHMYDKAYEKAICRNIYDDSYYLDRKFCCSVISNSFADSARTKMLNLLENYKPVSNGGRYRNNIGGRVKDKLEFESGYKFTLCFENSSTIGYTTEKLLEGFAGNGIPIYWGNPNIDEEFNKDSFVNCNRFSSLEEAMDYVKELDRDDSKYLKMVKEQIFGNGGERGRKESLQKQTVDFLRNIFEQPYAEAFRKCEEYKGKAYIERMRHFRVPFEAYRFRQRAKEYTRNSIKCVGQKENRVKNAI